MFPQMFVLQKRIQHVVRYIMSHSQEYKSCCMCFVIHICYNIHFVNVKTNLEIFPCEWREEWIGVILMSKLEHFVRYSSTWLVCYVKVKKITTTN